MGNLKATARLAAYLAASSFLFTVAWAQPDLVSSDSNGTPLTVDETAPFSISGYYALDVSADGRYVLLSNYPTGNPGLDANTGYPVVPDNCEILRKDRQTGSLITVFASSPDGFEFCTGAKISADGNTVVAAPAGSQVSCTEGGEVTALIARNIATGIDTEIKSFWLPPAGDISRICPGPDATIQYPGQAIHSVNGSANVAVLSRYAVRGGFIQPVFAVADIAAGTIEPVALAVEEGASPQINGVALSEDGTRLAVSAVIYSPYLPGSEPTVPDGSQPTGPSGALVYWQDGRFDSVDGSTGGDSWWQWGYEPVPREQRPSNIYIIDRIAGTQTVPAALADLPDGIILQPNAWSTDGQRLSFLETPQFIIGCYLADENGETECFPTETCAGADCELVVHHYNFAAAALSSYQTNYDPDTLSLCRPTDRASSGVVTNISCTPRLSRDGKRLLYARAVAHPFGGEWQPNPFSGDYLCVTRESLATPGAEPVFIECPSQDLGGGQPGPVLPGPIGGSPGQFPFVNGTAPLGNYFSDVGATASELPEPCYLYPTCTSYPFYWATGTAYHAPVNWYVQDIKTGHTSLVSVTGKGQLFQSNGTLFSDNGSTVIFRSQDPRLQNADPAALAATEAALGEACFWSPAGTSSNLRVATNDNTRFVVEDDFNVYRATPVFCPVPDPALQAHIFATDMSRGVNLAVMTFRSWGRNPGSMQTWLGNFGRSTATLVTLSIEISGLGNSGSVSFAAAGCDTYPATDATSNDSILVRCEFPALQRGDLRQLKWTMTGDLPAFATVTSTLEANENELRPGNNSDVDRVALWPRRPALNWLQALFAR